MLLQLGIHHLALIDEIELRFSGGLNVLSGETGAGKSIVVDAVNLVLGERAARDLVSQGAKRAWVEAVFDTRGNEAVTQQLAEMDLSGDDGTVVISRELTDSGRTICRVNGIIVPLQTLRRISQQLLDLHGQHEHQLLLDSRNHIAYLDEFDADAIAPLREQVSALYGQWHDLSVKIAQIGREDADRAQRLDMLRFQVEELENAALQENEEEELEAKRNFYRNAEHIMTAFDEADAWLRGADEGASALDLMRSAANAITSTAALSPEYAEVANRLDSLYYELEDVARDLSSLRDQMEFDEEEAERVEERLDLLHRLGRKYGRGTGEMLRYLTRIRSELDELENASERLEGLEKQHRAETKALRVASEALSAQRKKASIRFEHEIEAQLHDLGMKNAQMSVAFSQEEGERAERFSDNGTDQVELLFSANLGQDLRPLVKVASGGELSRIMLALKNLSARKPGIPRSMVFDEIDTGISGRMAQVVAEKMSEIGDHHQVICVTHLPQIAAMADQQYLVRKFEADGKTHTEVVPLTTEMRIAEVSRMVSGAAGSGMEHARTMLEEAAARKAELRRHLNHRPHETT